ncbi:MAG: DUF1648 domain-containing protein [Ignavibacteria bacterium]|jgi:uncharacterized membrane protein
MENESSIFQNKIKLKSIFIYILLISIAKSAFFYFILPDTVASHFNFKGEADAWSSKSSFIFFEIFITILLAVFFYFLEWIIPRAPGSLISLPNKDYWLSEGRKEITIEKFASFTYLFGSLTILFLLIVSGNGYIYNFTGSTIPFLFWGSLIAYLTVTTILLIKFYKEFKIKG